MKEGDALAILNTVAAADSEEMCCSRPSHSASPSSCLTLMFPSAIFILVG